MNIGIDISVLRNRLTGTARYVECLLNQLQNSGRAIETFTPGKNIIFPRSKLFKNIGILNRGGIQRHLYRKLHLAKEMESANIDCAIFPNYFKPAGFLKPSAVIIHDISFITHPHLYSKGFVYYYKNQLKKTLKDNPVIVTISEYTKRKISKHLNIKCENIFLLQAYSNINLPVDNNNISLAKISKPYFLFVGHIEPRKNLSFLIENFLHWKEINNMEIKLVITGELWRKSGEIKSLMNRFNGNSDILFTGYVDDAYLKNLYRNASAFVHTSFVEGFGLPVLEAMQFGLPILCSAGIATEEISKPYSVAVNPHDKNELIRGFSKLFEMVESGEKINYPAEYSHRLMSSQLAEILDVLEYKTAKLSGKIKMGRKAEEAVEKTLLYAAIFNSGIRKTELHKSIFDCKLNQEELDNILNELERRELIYFTNGFVYLNYSTNSNYKKRECKIDVAKINILLKIIKRLPFISSISFSGGTANYGLANHDDVDLFIIAKPHTVYLAYAVLHLLTYVMKARDLICINFLVDELNLTINDPQDLYVAHQIISLVPFKNKLLLNHFLTKNNWVKNHFPNFEYEDQMKYDSTRLTKIFLPFNLILKFIYRRRYKKYFSESGNSSIKLTGHEIKLHTNDHRVKILKRFEEEWQKYNEVKTVAADLELQ